MREVASVRLMAILTRRFSYGTLIAFANYLLEKSDMQAGRMSSSFTLVGDLDANTFPSCTCRALHW